MGKNSHQSMRVFFASLLAGKQEVARVYKVRKVTKCATRGRKSAGLDKWAGLRGRD